MHADHSSLWQMPEMIELKSSIGGKTVTFAQCMFGADWQKYTTFMYSAGFDEQLAPLQALLCTHPDGTHGASAGGVRNANGVWNSREAAAFPADLNLFLAQAVLCLVTGPVSRLDPSADAHVPCDEEVHPARQEADVSAADLPAADALPSPLPVSPLIAAPSPAKPAPSPLPRGFPELHVSPQPRARRDPLSWRAAAPRGGRIPTRGAIRRGDVADPFVPTDLEHVGEALPTDGVGAYSYLCVSRLGSALHYLSAPLGRALLAQPGSADPRSRQQALKQDKEGWIAAEKKELKNHHDNGSWSLIDRAQVPAGRRLIRLIWVYKVKRSGALKARLCVQGCTQMQGVDFDQTFCATMRSGSLRLLCSLAARHSLDMRRWDFVSAYLQGELLEDEVVYCQMPPGYELVGRDGRQRVCRVEKPIYGMAQAGRRWQRTIFPWLTDPAQGFTQLRSDTCVFYRTETVNTPDGPRVERLIVGCYVDDLFVLSSHDDEHSLYHAFTLSLQHDWDVEDEGPINDLLNVEISREGEHVVLRQTAYIDKLVQTYCVDGTPTRVQSTTAPCSKELPELVMKALCYVDKPEPELLKAYQSLVGALLYCASNTRPDIAFAVSCLCRAMSRPTDELLEAARGVLYYLHRHRDVGLRFEADSVPLYGMSDSDWAVKHSTSGAVFMLNHAAISWGSKKQPTVALSSCEAELMAASEACKEAVFIDAYLGELGESNGEPVALHVDNKGARDLAYNPEHHQRVKHIERRHFFIRELVEEMRITVPYVPSAENLGDFFTKPLQGPQFFALRDTIMNHVAS
jgi:hypothetical protein